MLCAPRTLLLGLLLAASPASQGEPSELGRPADWSVESPLTLVAIAAGSVLRLAPAPGSPVLAILPQGRLPILEAPAPDDSGSPQPPSSWVRVRFGEQVGWVDLTAPLRPTARPGPPVPVALDLGPGWEVSKAGPFSLYTTLRNDHLLRYLAQVADQHGRIYSERYGLAVDAHPLGSLVLFSHQREMSEFQRQRGHQLDGMHPGGYYRAPDLVVLYRGTLRDHQVAATLVHELTHLSNWRRLRGSGQRPLARWLDEGMATDLALSRSDRRGHLEAEPLDPRNLLLGHGLGRRLLEVDQAWATEEPARYLGRFLALDEASFLDRDAELHYLTAGLLVRYLAQGEAALQPGFRAYLTSIADGGSDSPQALAHHLGRDHAQIGDGFRRWLRRQQGRFRP